MLLPDHPGVSVNGESQWSFIYSFDIRVEGKEGVDEVWVDAMTGAVISVKHEQS